MNWDPLHDLMALHERVPHRAVQPDAAWSPSMDLLETDTAFLIVVELPGLDSNHFSISVTDNQLTVSGERPALVPPPQRYLRMERGHGRFARTFSFDEIIDVEGVEASVERGMLTVRLPKAAASERRIPVK